MTAKEQIEIESRVNALLSIYESKAEIRRDLNAWYSHYLGSDEYNELSQTNKDQSFVRYTELIEFFN